MVKNSELKVFSDGNTTSSAEFSIEKLLKALEKQIQIAPDWFKENNTILNPEEFEAAIVKPNSNLSKICNFNIDRNQVTSEKFVKLLGINVSKKNISMNIILQYENPAFN